MYTRIWYTTGAPYYGAPPSSMELQWQPSRTPPAPSGSPTTATLRSCQASPHQPIQGRSAAKPIMKSGSYDPVATQITEMQHRSGRRQTPAIERPNHCPQRQQLGRSCLIICNLPADPRTGSKAISSKASSPQIPATIEQRITDIRLANPKPKSPSSSPFRATPGPTIKVQAGWASDHVRLQQKSGSFHIQAVFPTKHGNKSSSPCQQITSSKQRIAMESCFNGTQCRSSN
ncbi:hypothetical protein ACLOJK_004352 [Asimina triloba]